MVALPTGAQILTTGAVGLCLTLLSTAALAQQASPQAAPVSVEQLFDLIQVQRAQIEAQQRRIEQLEYAIRGITGAGQPGTNFSQADYSGQPGQVAQQGQTQGQQQQNQSTPQGQAVPQQPVGEEDRDAQRRRIDVSGVQDIGGVLTRKNHLVFEPSVEYENTSSTRFFFDGVEIIETVLVGDIEVSDADRQSITAAGTLRYGLTSRSEIEVKVPFVYRNDDVTQEVIGAGGATTSSLDAANIGDIEVSGRYQLNSGRDDWPIFVANARIKSNTGRGPFDVSRDADGIETELSTGSGFWAIQPGLTMIYPTDPAVFFANVSYTHSFGEDVDETIGGAEVGNVQPGDVVGFGFGMGFSLNEKASFSVGYAHDFVFETEQEIDGVTFESESFEVGRLSLGFSYALSNNINVNLNTQIGVTDDAPDVVLTLRTPLTFDLN
ncbi:transporter [Pelagibius litoralis]|uniref:Transporter n=1 Tax=Pelagibius litoralis TaxID=374515 RepID=A0A967C2Z4_9PROT|nr:transporter [Pelagibius litoralis]NIA67450.1 transporter [Pelagibius litoralis]